MKKKTLLVLFFCLLLTGCVYKTTETNKTVGKIQTSKEANEEETKDKVIENEVKVVPAKVGEYVEGDVWKISLLKAKEYNSIDDKFYSDKPEVDGNKFIVLFFDVENISSSDEHFNTLYFESYIDDYSVDETFFINKPDNYSYLSGDVASGKKLKGYIAYEVEPNWKEIEFSYKNWVGTSGKIATFLVTPDMITE